MTQVIPFTAQGLSQIKSEKEKLLVKRKPAVENLKIAREMGDLSENGAYKAARAELSSIDSRLRHLTRLISSAKIIQTSNNGVIQFGSTVDLSSGNKHFIYEIVGSFESDPSIGKISHLSPIGKMLIGKKAGDKITISTPNGLVSYQVIGVK